LQATTQREGRPLPYSARLRKEILKSRTQIHLDDPGEHFIVLSNLPATNVRWRMMALIMAVNMLPSLGKISMGITANYIEEEFSISTTSMGWILGAFAIGYALFQVPGGWAGDRYGPRKILTLSILVYSFCLAAITIVPQLPLSHLAGLVSSFAILRFLIGAGEAFTPPNSARVVASWISTTQRGLGISFTTVGVGAGGAVTPLAMAWTAEHWGWRAALILGALVGVAVALLWGIYATDRPEEHSHVNAAELALICPSEGVSRHKPTANLSPGRPPWKIFFSSSSVWALLLSYLCRAYTMFFFDTWFFIYLTKIRGLTIMRGGLWASTPYLAVLLLSPLGGAVSDLAVRKFGRRRGRQTAVWIGMSCSAILVWIGCHLSNNTAAIFLVASAAGFNMFSNVTWWATCIDLAPNYAASLAGVMNMCGGLGGFLAPIATAYIATKFGWTWAFNSIAILSVTSGLFWLLVKADQTLRPEATMAA
jgi:ACS family glucarate transporter-like MFS transporter